MHGAAWARACDILDTVFTNILHMGLEDRKLYRGKDDPLRVGGEYSLEKWRNAPDETLTPEDLAFLETYNENLDTAIDRVQEHPSLAMGILRETIRPELWKVLFNLGKAEGLLEKHNESKTGQEELARDEAEKVNEEYGRRAQAIIDAMKNFTDFVEEANGRTAPKSE